MRACADRAVGVRRGLTENGKADEKVMLAARPPKTTRPTDVSGLDHSGCGCLALTPLSEHDCRQSRLRRQP
jgi:hypothetical protein